MIWIKITPKKNDEPCERFKMGSFYYAHEYLNHKNNRLWDIYIQKPDTLKDLPNIEKHTISKQGGLHFFYQYDRYENKRQTIKEGKEIKKIG